MTLVHEVRTFWLIHATACLVSALAVASDTGRDRRVEYNRDVRPILADACFKCHGPDSASRRADLRLDQREAAVESSAIVPGKPDESEMIRRIFTHDDDERMPPTESRRALSLEQKDVLRTWVAQSAEYQPHWSLIPPVRSALPPVQQVEWVKNPIDRFVLARLEAVGLRPAPEADRRTLARRVALDLTGLPPSPEAVEAFVEDGGANAYEKYVDRMLSLPQWGEHRARYWLDAARYADTHGVHFDNYREMWSYRDWVIHAFNRNLGFDQFTIEQLAGDVLPGAGLDQQIASGFHRCNITTNEGGIIDDEYLVLYARDRTETTAKVWLGLTANCAVCHDHKYDPLSQREFYEMAAFFNNVTQPAKDGNIKDSPPIVTVPLAKDRLRWTELQSAIPRIRERQETRRQQARAEFDGWRANTKPDPEPLAPKEALSLHAPLHGGMDGTMRLSVAGQWRAKLTDGIDWETGHVADQAARISAGGVVQLTDVGDFDTNQAFSYGAWIKLPKPATGGAVFARMDDQHDYRGWDLWVEKNRIGCHIVHRWNDDAIKVVSSKPLKAGEWTHVFVTYDGSAKPEGVTIYVDGQPQPVEVQSRNLKGSIRTAVPWKLAQRHSGQRVDGLVLQDVRIYPRRLAAEEVEGLATTSRANYLLAKPTSRRTDAETRELYDWWLDNQDPSYQACSKERKELEREEAAIKSRGTVAHVMQERNEPASAYVLFRGEYDKRRDAVQPDTPKMLPPFPPGSPRNRLGFAKWLLQPDQPRMARVTVNRFWQDVFGTGLVRTAEDFGVAGEAPTHPDLLDWLAVEFRESGWDVKRFFKLMLLSATYRQAAITTPENREKDFDNRLLSRGPRFRMDAETIRDYALAASGLLVPTIGGPSVRPYQPDGVWEAVAMIGSNTRDYRRDHGEDLYRRSLYTFWKRSAPPALMEIFNAPTREFCVVRRERTNTPLQALATLNDEQFVEAARHVADLAIGQVASNADDRLNFMAVRFLCRPLRQEEISVLRASVEKLEQYYRTHLDDATKLVSVGESKPNPNTDPAVLAAWTMLGNELMNLDEVLNK